MMKHIIYLTLFTLGFTLCASVRGSNYVTVCDSGRYFQLEDGTDFLPLGFDQMPDFPESLFQIYPVNNWDYDKEALREYFNMMHDHGVNVLRVWGEAPDSGYRYLLLENPVGVFNPAFAQFFDDLFELAEDYKIYILLTPYDNYWHHFAWAEYPYNAINGGPCHSESDGLTSDACFEYQKARMKWFVDRYGNSDYLFAWDIMNEVDLWWGGPSGSEIRAWTDRMTSWLTQYERQTWGKNHMITLNTAGCPTSGDLKYAVFQHPNCDFATNHMYYTEIADPANVIASAVVVNQYVNLALDQFVAGDMRPFFDSESGPISGGLADVNFDNEYYHNMIWAHLASGGAGSNLRWPFRLFQGPTDEMFDSVLGMSRIIKHIKWSQFASDNIDSNVSVTNTGGHTVIDMACGDSYTALVFILQDSRYTTGTISGADLNVTNMTAGIYRVKYFNSYTGELISAEDTAAVSGTVTTSLPNFDKDIVAILINQDASPTINRKPDAWLTSPSAGTGTGQVTSVTLSADAVCADDTTVDYVEFWANYNNGSSTAWRLLNTDSTAPYSYVWNISSVSDQAVEFRVDVTDNKGIEKTSAAALLSDGGSTLERSAGDVTNSYGSIEFPPVDTTIDTSQTVTLKARAWDSSSGVNRVKFWIQGSPSDPGGTNTLLGEVYTPTNGVYTLNVDLSSYVNSTRWITIDIVDNNNNTIGPADYHAGIVLSSSPTDTKNPTAVFTAPWGGDVITQGQAVTISADAEDDVSGVNRVEFWGNYDGGWHFLGTDTTAPYAITWYPSMSNSQKISLTADVFDNAGKSATPVSWLGGIVYESSSGGDTFDPWCHIYDPDVYTSIASPVTLSAVAGDRGSGGVSQVTFRYYQDGSWHTISSDPSAPYECKWNITGIPNGGTTQIRVDVEDQNGNLLTSSDVHNGITVYTGSDINGDGAVNLKDFSIMANQWLQTPQVPSADIALEPGGDGVVNLLDFALLAEDWLYMGEQQLYLKFDEINGDTAQDNSIYARSGLLINNPARSSGITGGAIEFDGLDDYVEITGYKGISGGASRTCTAWIKTIQPTDEIISWGEDYNGGRWVIRVNEGGQLRAEVNGGNIIGSTLINDDTWHHIAVVLENDGSPDITEVRLYVDGNLETISASVDEPVNTGSYQNVQIGMYYIGERYFEGLIDEVRIYDETLSAAQIQSIYQSVD